MLCFEVNCSTSLWSKPYKITPTSVTGHIGVAMQMPAIMHPYECNVIGGFFELKKLLEFSFSPKVTQMYYSLVIVYHNKSRSLLYT